MSIKGFDFNGVVHKYDYNALENIPDLETDKTLTIDGAPADAKATGDRIANLQALVGSPLTASTAAGMTDNSKVYVYVGSETGYTNGNWYYYDGSAWVSGGVYNSVAVDIDTTLTLSNKAPDSKVVGDAISSLNEDLSDYNSLYHYSPGYLGSNGYMVGQGESSKEITSDFIPVTQGVEFKFTITQSAQVDKWFALCEYDDNYQLMGSRKTITPPFSTDTYEYRHTVNNDSVKYIRFSYRTYDGVVSVLVDPLFSQKIYQDIRFLNGFCKPIYNLTALKLRNGEISRISNDEIVSNPVKSRVFSDGIYTTSTPMNFTAKKGFQLRCYYKLPTDSEYQLSSWVAFYNLTIPGTKFAIIIKRSNEDVSEVADVYSFGEAIIADFPLNSLCIRDTLIEQSEQSQQGIQYGLAPIISSNSDKISIILNDSEATITFPADTVVMLNDGYYAINDRTIVDFSSSIQATSALKIIVDIENDTFYVKSFTYSLKKSEVLLAVIRRNVNNPTISIGCPYILNGYLYGIKTANSFSVVKAINHRGYDSAPENTLIAFKRSKLKGFSCVECDVNFTSDGIAVLLHDDSINRTARNADGTTLSETININDIAYEQLMSYDFGIYKSQTYAGTKIPTFTQFMVLCRNLGLHPYIEVKGGTNEQIENCIDTVKSCGMSDKVTWISFSLERLSYIKNYDATARLGFLVSNITSDTITQVRSLITTENNVFIDASYTNVTTESIQLCLNASIPLEVYVINNPSDITSLDPYISGVTSDNLIAGEILYDANIN